MDFNKLTKWCLTIPLAIILTSCSSWKIPFVYQVEIPQGNLVTQEMVDQLEPGMTKDQVRFILGTPTLIDTFHQNRWDYPYHLIPTHGRQVSTHLIVYFDEQGLYTHYTGDLPPVEATRPAQE